MVSILIEPGFRLGKYEVMEHLATGGMGAVFKAVDRELGRIVAISQVGGLHHRYDRRAA